MCFWVVVVSFFNASSGGKVDGGKRKDDMVAGEGKN